MAKITYWRGEKFDPEWDFVVVKMMTVENVTFHPGQEPPQIFDKTLVPTRRLRQMYESRKLARIEDHDPVAEAKRAEEREAERVKQNALRVRVRDLLLEAGISEEDLNTPKGEFTINNVAAMTEGLSDDEIRNMIKASGAVPPPPADDEVSKDEERAFFVLIDETNSVLDAILNVGEGLAVLEELHVEEEKELRASLDGLRQTLEAIVLIGTGLAVLTEARERATDAPAAALGADAGPEAAAATESTTERSPVAPRPKPVAPTPKPVAPSPKPVAAKPPKARKKNK